MAILDYKLVGLFMLWAAYGSSKNSGGLVDFIAAAKPSTAFLFGTPAQRRSITSPTQCNGSWLVSPGAESLGVSNLTRRDRMVLNASQFRLASENSVGWSGNSRCHLVEHPWPGKPSNLPFQSKYVHWRWNAGPTLPAPCQMYLNGCTKPSTKSRQSDDTAMEPQSIGANFNLPGASTQQQPPPSISVIRQDQQDLILPPDRVVEPFTVEGWVLPVNAMYGATVAQRGMQGYSGTVGYSPEQTYTPLVGFIQPFAMRQLPLSYTATTFTSLVAVVDCPKEWYDPACTPLDVPVDPMDLCMHATVWDIQGKGFPAEARLHGTPRNVLLGDGPGHNATNGSRNVHSTAGGAICPVRSVSPVGDIDKQPPGFYFNDPIYASHNITPRVQGSSVTPLRSPTHRPADLSAIQETPKWHQLVATVWPPGTVAVLPYDDDVKILGETADYAWRVNRGHVVQTILDAPASQLSFTNRSTGRIRPSQQLDSFCHFPQAPSDKVFFPNRARRVLLDDASCVASRSCAPDTGTYTDRGGPLDGILRDYAESDAVQGAFPTARMGCAMSYDVDFSRYRSGTIPADMVAAQNGMISAIGGHIVPYLVPGTSAFIPAIRGRYNSTREHNQSLNAELRLGVSRRLQSIDPRSLPTAADVGGAVGPYAVYRGSVLSRAYPPFPNTTLPPVAGGSWVPYRTQALGSFQGRIGVMAVCDDPELVPVDPGVENLNGGLHGRVNPDMVASVTRVWYSYWLGHPALEPDTTLYDLGRLSKVPSAGNLRAMHGDPDLVRYSEGSGYGSVVPRMECMSDVPESGSFDLRWSAYSTAWAQRSRTSRAGMRLVLTFDRNRWPAAQSVMGSYMGQAPGLDYPDPSPVQLRWLESDVLHDLQDLAGEGQDDTIRSWEVRVVDVQALSPLPAPANDSIEAMQLPVHVTVEVRVGRLEQVLPTQVPGLSGKRWMSAGSVVQRVSAVLEQRRPGAFVGTWVTAVDPGLVSWWVELPCLRYLGLEFDRRCELSAQRWLHLGGTWAQILSVGLWVSLWLILVILGVCQLPKFASACCSVVEQVYSLELLLRVMHVFCGLAVQWVFATQLVSGQLDGPGDVLIIGLCCSVVCRGILVGVLGWDVGGSSLSAHAKMDSEQRGESQGVDSSSILNRRDTTGTSASTVRPVARGHFAPSEVQVRVSSTRSQDARVAALFSDTSADTWADVPGGEHSDGGQGGVNRRYSDDSSRVASSQQIARDDAQMQGRIRHLARAYPTVLAAVRMATVLDWEAQLLLGIDTRALLGYLDIESHLKQQLLLDSSGSEPTARPANIAATAPQPVITGSKMLTSDNISLPQGYKASLPVAERPAAGTTARVGRSFEAVRRALWRQARAVWWRMRLAEVLLLIGVLAWSGACMTGTCPWGSCSWTRAGPVQDLDGRLLWGQRLQAVGLAWVGSLVLSVSMGVQLGLECFR